MLAYNPTPPFHAGSPANAGEALVQKVQVFGKQLIEASSVATQQAAMQLNTRT
ncbi:hypothetical protein [Chroococcidiopsis sp. TS-821]|uniref:hypothetical protein n=1 Tax=Chroococcidiopsis sp. TS-821 TaxID=1378066 RepID=UPI001AEFE40B|nr:hypothetical protein [Chroococcidiopsis sp. TS-821]